MTDGQRVDGAAGCVCPAADPDLLACYAFDANDPGFDGSQYGKNLTLKNAWPESSQHGSALRLTGNDSYTTVPHPQCFDVSTIELWFKANLPPRVGTRAGLIDKNGEYGVFLGDEGRTIWCAYENVLTERLPLASGSWNHVACVRTTSNTLEIYLNGAPVSSVGLLPNGECSEDLIIGANGTSASAQEEFFDGWIDSVRLWKTARTATQIADAFKGSCP